jgi:hypothetical protein
LRREERADNKMKREHYGKKHEVGDFLSINPYTTETLLKEKETDTC